MALTVAQLEKFIKVDRYMVPAVVKPMKLNDKDREQWINNDEGLYNWRRSQNWLSMREFIRKNRAELDKHIHAVLNKKPVS